MSLEDALIEHCSPTLASLKAAGLFSCQSPCMRQLKAQADALDERLCGKGLSLRVIPGRSGRSLCYLYRERHLRRILQDEAVARFLEQQGYCRLDPCGALDTLCRRLEPGKDFPHEIGLFLGYPLEDVIAFIENKGQNCLCCGCWKAYSNACDAQRLFEKYRKCTEVYKRLYSAGRPLEKLAVAM